VWSGSAHSVASVLEPGATEHYDSLAFVANDGSEIDLRLNVAPLLVDGAVGPFSLRNETHHEQPSDLSTPRKLLEALGLEEAFAA
jgi:hypothetical protein